MSRSGGMLHAALGGCLAVILLISPALSQGENQEAAQEPQAQAADQAAVEPPAASAPIASTKPGSNGHDDESQRHKADEPQEHPPGFWDGFWRWWDANVGGRDGQAQWIMAIFGAIATGISIWAIWLLKKTLKATEDTVRLSREMTDAANRQADAAIRLEAARLVMVGAYVNLPNRGGGENVKIPDEGMAVKVVFRNAGKTAAMVRQHAVLWTLGKGPPTPRYPMGSIYVEHADRLIENGNTVLVTDAIRTIAISDENRKAIEKNETILWAFGFVEFEDWFGMQRREDFMFRWELETRPNRHPATLGRFVPHYKGRHYVLDGD